MAPRRTRRGRGAPPGVVRQRRRRRRVRPGCRRAGRRAPVRGPRAPSRARRRRRRRRTRRPRRPGPAANPDCPERGHGPHPEAPPVSPAEITQASQQALRALARETEPLPCGAVAEWASHVRNHAHGVAPPERPLAGAEADAFSHQWAAAVAASAGLATTEQAAAAGYAQSSSQVPGVGTHWINWTLVDAPFDPARPSMLLFDETPGRPARLVGFSYWVRNGSEPEGFAGANDAWHSHLGLCFVRGRLYLEGVPAALACPGTWLNGGDLWMLHARVVPDLPNPDGRFAPANRAVP